MIEKNVILEINSISNTKKQIDDRYSELVSMINKYEEMIEDTKNIYDTESATLYRKIAVSYIDLVHKYLNNEFKPFIDKLDEIKNVYMDEFNAISESVQGEE